jgi:membrane protein YdbS with pleckstrin-like domain
MNWEVTGADRDSGAERKLIVDADDEASARRRASRQNLMVADLRPLEADDSVAGKRVAPPRHAAVTEPTAEVVVYKTTLHPFAVFIVPVIFCFLIIGFLALPFAYLRYRFTNFVVTNKRITIKRGWLNRSTFEMLLQKVESIHVDQTFFGRLLGCGTIVICGTGGSRELFPGIKDPAAFRQHAMDAIERVAR